MLSYRGRNNVNRIYSIIKAQIILKDKKKIYLNKYIYDIKSPKYFRK